jgi:hypothetical protein
LSEPRRGQAETESVPVLRPPNGITCTGAAQVMGSKVPDAGTLRGPFHDVPNRLGRDSITPDILQPTTRQKITPPSMAAAVVHSSTARFAHTGTGTVRMCFPLPIRSAITQCSSRTWRSSILRPTSSARRSPHPMSSARIARSRLPRRPPDGGPPSKVLD